MRVLVITGAGVSAESGIPTFRGRDGYWRNLDPAKLATPEAFAKDPGLVWEWYRERRERIRNAQPNPAHKAIAKLAQHAHEFLLVTQNVDDLHVRAGSLKDKMVQIHGDIFVTRCSRCDFGSSEHDKDEQLPWDELRRVEDYLEDVPCDFVIVAGTTATFGYIIDWALRAIASDGELVEVNPDETPLSRFATQRLREPAAIALPRLVDELVAQ
jgi:NAD-dependent deacetylase